MEIFWLGHASFRIRGKLVSLITDPFDPGTVGLSYPKETPDIVTISHEHADHNFLGKIEGSPKIIRGPGEYEVKGVSIYGVATWHDKSRGQERGPNTIFVIELDGIRIAHLGDLGHKLIEEQLAEIGNINVLLVPIGGFYTIGPETAAEVVTQLEPNVVIPMHYQTSGLSQEIFGKLAGVGEFVKAVGMTPKQMLSYPIKPELIPEETELVILERKEK